MRAATNPYNPGSGLPPPALAGRDDDLQMFRAMLERTEAGLPNRGVVLTGVRGVGKTVLLNRMRDRAESAGWFVVSVEARPDAAGATSVRRVLGRNVSARARQLHKGRAQRDRVQKALASVTAFNISLGTSGIDLGVSLEPGRADSGDLDVDLAEMVQDLCEALAAGTAFGLFVDEMQDLDRGLLRALLVTQHEAGQRGWPFYIVGAGLPQLPTVLAETRSYAERIFSYRATTPLAPPDAQRALVDPLNGLGVSYAEEALDILVEESGGYPYFLQEFGSSTWEVARDWLIGPEDARAGVALGLERLDAGFFQSRWDRASKAQRRLLAAMAEDNGRPSATSDVVRRMGIKPKSLGPYRARLIEKGLIYAPERGTLAYTVPGMADFVRRHSEDG